MNKSPYYLGFGDELLSTVPKAQNKKHVLGFVKLKTSAM